ncbi:MAG: prepilin peptidase, partial [Candidatus Doudnabacteria bacterium]|nr:prepilin peptidase [Candidatus Doudnabacteria bacterium]
ITFLYRLLDIWKFNQWNFQLLINPLLSAFLASLFFLTIVLVSKGKWMGFGDVKFMFFLGLALGWPDVLVCFILAFLLGTVFSLPLLILGKKTLSSKLPFGTFLSVAAALALFFGDKLFAWYLAVLGF